MVVLPHLRKMLLASSCLSPPHFLYLLWPLKTPRRPMPPQP